LYFSCKNYQELAQVKITKVVGYFTANQKKLVLNFSDLSMIFYAIYKKQEIHFTIGVTTLQESPRKEICFCNVVPGAAGRRGLPEFDELAGVLCRGRAGEEHMGH
jgi:hypothetical protein